MRKCELCVCAHNNAIWRQSHDTLDHGEETAVIMYMYNVFLFLNNLSLRRVSFLLLKQICTPHLFFVCFDDDDGDDDDLRPRPGGVTMRKW